MSGRERLNQKRLAEKQRYYQEIMESVNGPDYPWFGWGVGFFPFNVEGVRSGLVKEGSTPEERAEDLERVLPNLAAVNAFMEKSFAKDKRARAKAVNIEGVACKDCGGELIEITVPHISGQMYLGFLYSPDCARGAQIPTM